MFTNISRPSVVDVQMPFTVGDLFAADSTTTVAKIPDIAVGNVLLSGGVGAVPAWGKVTLTSHVSGVLPAINGGTGVANTGTITNASNTTITGGGTLALGGFTLTVPATGTVGLLGTTNTWTQTNAFAAITATNITNSALTAGRIVISSTAGLESDSANLTFGSNSKVIGVRRTPHTWGGSYGGMEIISTSFMEYNDGASNIQCSFFGNAYDSGAGSFKYAETGATCAFRLFPTSRLFQWQTAASGSADAAITFTTVMSLDNIGLTISPTTGASLIVSSTDAASITLSGGILLDGATTKTIKYTNGTANAAVAVTFGAVGPTGSTAGNQVGWLRVNIGGTDRYIPYW